MSSVDCNINVNNKIMKFKWFVGVDISKKTLDVTLYNSQTPRKSCHTRISNDLKGFKEILHWIKKNVTIQVLI